MSDILNDKSKYSFDITFEKYRCCAQLLNNSPERGREKLIDIIENRDDYNKDLECMLIDLIEAAGFYPYLNKEKLDLISTQQIMREGHYNSQFISGVSFHEEQKFYSDIIKSGKNLILSAPTSFGKSLLIEDIIASKKYNNILIIQPTLALLDETRRKIKKYKEYYKMIVRTGQEYSNDDEKGNIFLLTAERVCEYQNLPLMDYLIVDEFYKISSSRDDERHQSLNNALIRVFESNPKFYFLGPNIDGVSSSFLEKYNAIFEKTEYSLVKCNTFNVYERYINEFGDRGKKASFKESVLFDLLWEKKNEQSIIYCSSPSRARRVSKNFTEYLLSKKNITKKRSDIPLIEWIEENISTQWSLIDSLLQGVAFHDGSLPRHMTSSLIDYFNENLVSFMFCTSTIIEGVNSNAKNIIYFDAKKGASEIDYFDYSNIKGRAGRLMQHYSGNVYNFNPPPKPENVYIDIPFVDQKPVTEEILINISEHSVINKNSDEYIFLNSLSFQEKALFSKNKINIQGQKKLLDYLVENFQAFYDKLSWNFSPKYSQLEFCLDLCWTFLLKEEDKPSNLSYSKMTKLTYDYASSQSINRIIKNIYEFNLGRIKDKTDARKQKALDDAIRDGFHFLRQWFQYKLPKLLLVLNELQTHACLLNRCTPGNYSYYCSLIENDFLDEQYAMLIEYGIPKSAISRLRPYIGNINSEDAIVNKIIDSKLYEASSLIEYEKVLLRRNILN